VNRRQWKLTGRSIEELVGTRPGELFQESQIMLRMDVVVPVGEEYDHYANGRPHAAIWTSTGT